MGLGVQCVSCALFVDYGVLFYGVFCSWCLCVCYVFACVACGVLCDVVLVVLGMCVGVLLICLCGVLMLYNALSHGLCLRCVFVRVGLKVFVRVVCDSLCDVV